MRQTILSAFNRTRGTVLCARVELVRGLRVKSRGLIGRPELARNHGMLFERGRAEPFMWFHTLLMRFPIDIVFLDRNGLVITIDRELAPWRASSLVFRARKALELASGRAEETGTLTGDIITFDTPA